TSSSQRGRLGSIVAQCQVLITRRLMRNFSARAKNAKAVNRSFSPQATSSRIPYATLAMAISRNSYQKHHGCHLTRPARFYERDELIRFEIFSTRIFNGDADRHPAKSRRQ